MKLLRAGSLAVAALTLVFAATVPVATADDDGAAGHVYVLNNNLVGPNSITAFARAGDGRLTQQGVVPIGGVGSIAAFADGTEGSVIRTPDGSRLFAVDAGSNQISVIDAHDGQLSPTGIFSSGGVGPVSLSYRSGLLYVLNAANASASAANVAGFLVDEHGGLHPIAGATRPLSTAHPNPAQVQISPDGSQLVVTEKSTNLIDIYQVASNGSLSAPTSVPPVGVYPFGMAFDPTSRRALLVDDGISGAVTAYQLQPNAQLQLVDGPVADHQIAPCWMVITNNGHYAYTSNADSQTISGYAIGQDGTISLLNANGATGTTPADTFPIEESLSRNSRYLYVLDTRLLLPTPGPATLSGFRIENNGQLSSIIDSASISLPFTAIGQTTD
jgi:6-phosphogluconolactonase (cycloisomerase 2 family)